MSEQVLDEGQLTQVTVPRELYNYVLILHEQGKTDDEIREMLSERGHSHEVIEHALIELYNPTKYREDINKEANDEIKYGAFWFLGGLVITVGTFLYASSNGGGSYFITWGPMLYGGIKMFKGYAKK